MSAAEGVGIDAACIDEWQLLLHCNSKTTSLGRVLASLGFDTSLVDHHGGTCTTVINQATIVNYSGLFE